MKNFGLMRSRWAAIGAAVAVSFGAGGLFTVLAAPSTASSEYTAISPCRLVNTRSPGTIGPKSTPFTAGQTFTFAVRGTNGQCVIPSAATAVTANITVVNATAQSFLTVFPADVGLPNASTINWKANQTPLANGATLALSAAGEINVNNNAGTVDVIIDITGYFQPSAAIDPIRLDSTFPVTSGNSTMAPIGVSTASSAQIAAVAWMAPRDCVLSTIRARIYGSITGGTFTLRVAKYNTAGDSAGSSTSPLITSTYVSGTQLNVDSLAVSAGERVVVGLAVNVGPVTSTAGTTAHISMLCV